MPTEAILREEATRLITVREGEGREEISTTRGVIRALAHTALKGGPLAQRNYIQMVTALDREEARLRQERFKFWQSYVQKARDRMQDAATRGQGLPTYLPHPDDIVFDYTHLTVRFTGPCDPDDAAQVEQQRRLSHLCLELSLYHEEDHCRGEGSLDKARIGFWLLSHIALEVGLPKRLRMSKEDYRAIERRQSVHRNWLFHLERECEELGLPFERRRKNWPVVELSELGIKFS
ncbi:hypothetical protein ASD76_17150 [Altererythrobacter sp. Root672]|nr:hypothetical protein ASD76_17150 [Altererythrobacter sp. Root672]